MEQPSVLRTINDEIADYQSKVIQVVPGLTYNQYDTINKIYYYHNSKFTTGDIDEDGDKKYFYNINRNPCEVFTKAVDFDTKNIRLLTAGGGDPTKTWFMERDLKYWMREEDFGKTLNRLFAELPIFGTVVLKMVDGRPYFVDLRNFITEQGVDTLDDSNYKTEIHHLTISKFKKLAKEMKWPQAKVDEACKKYYEMKGKTHMRLYERYGEVCLREANGKEYYEYHRTFIADVGNDELDQAGKITARHTGVQLESEYYDGHPYREFHARKMSGRWLGIGVVESLFEPQVRMNETSNLQSKASYWAALRIFQTRDAGIARNLLSDSRNGDVLHVDSEITQVDMSDRNLAFFAQDEQKWMRNRDELTFSYDVVQGERLPAGTPLGSAQLAVSQTLTYFETIQENIALDVKAMLFEEVIPQFEKERTVEHTIRLVGQDLDQYIAMVRNDLVLKEVIRLASERGQLVSEAERDAISVAVEESIKQKKEKIITVPTGFYKDLKYDVDIDITGESIDTRVRSATLFAMLQAITADPTMTTDPVKREFLSMMGEDGGVKMADILSVVRPNPQNMVPQKERGAGGAGGGVSAPSVGAPQMVGNTSTI